MKLRSNLSLLAFLVLVATACGGSDESSDPDRSDTSERPTTPEGSDPVADEGMPRVAVYYQSIAPQEDLSKFGDVDTIVTVRQRNESAAVDAIHAAGADAYRYVQSYWFPSDRDYDGFDIGQNLDWAYCESGSDPKVGRDVGGVPWYFIDANERAAREQFRSLLEELKGHGYDGIMFDRGLAALTGADASRAGIWYKQSTCTEDPVDDGANLADAYVGLMSDVEASGLALFQNYGFSPFHPGFPYRPDPADPACQEGMYATCNRLDSGKEFVDLFLNEAVAHPQDQSWETDFATNLANEQDDDFGGKVVGLITEGTLDGAHSREDVYFQYARVRLFDMPVAIFTGDDGCNGKEGLCNRHGIFPELNSADLGTPIGNAPTATNCVGGSEINCVWIRQYDQAVVVVNVTDQSQAVSVELEVDGCRSVQDLYSGTSLEDGTCLESVALELPPWEGRPLLLTRR